jgi:hydroxymethylbilane synthase
MSMKPLVKYIVGGRGSPLSKIQIEEVQTLLKVHAPHVDLQPLWVETRGDKDRKTSLRTLGQTDFFTKEIDELLLKGICRLAVHSAKDLPEPLPPGLAMAALTEGLDSSDSLVLRDGQSLQTLPQGAKIATSSIRREQMVRELRSDLVCVDIRGNIGERLAVLDKGQIDGLIVAECALIRLQLTHRNRIRLAGQAAPLQGKLAVIVRENDGEMMELFKCLDSRCISV